VPGSIPCLASDRRMPLSGPSRTEKADRANHENKCWCGGTTNRIEIFLKRKYKDLNLRRSETSDICSLESITPVYFGLTDHSARSKDEIGATGGSPDNLQEHPPCNPGDCPHILISAVRSRLLVSSLKVFSKLFVLQPNVKKKEPVP